MTLRLAVALLALLAGCSGRSGPTAEEPGLTRCEGPRHPICTQDWSPVCGQQEGGEWRTYSNACSACADPAVVGHRPGECPP